MGSTQCFARGRPDLCVVSGAGSGAGSAERGRAGAGRGARRAARRRRAGVAKSGRAKKENNYQNAKTAKTRNLDFRFRRHSSSIPTIVRSGIRDPFSHLGSDGTNKISSPARPAGVPSRTVQVRCLACPLSRMSMSHAPRHPSAFSPLPLTRSLHITPSRPLYSSRGHRHAPPSPWQLARGTLAPPLTRDARPSARPVRWRR